MPLMLKNLREPSKLEFSNIRSFFLPLLICPADSLREVATAGLSLEPGD